MAKAPYVRFSTPASGPHGLRVDDLVKAIREQISSGLLPKGSRLPPLRVVSHQSGASKNTVAAAYDELAAQGLLENKARQGFYVSLPEGKDRKVNEASQKAAAPELYAASFPIPTKAHWGKGGKDKKDISLGSVFIDRNLLPAKRIEQCFRSVLRQPGIHYMYDTQGLAPLRRKIAQRLKARGIPAHEDHIIITTGSQQAIDLVTRALKKRSIAIESPTYSVAKLMFEMNQMEVTGLPLDPFNGVDMGEWRKRIAASRPAALYLTPTFNNPTGYSYTSSELADILSISNQYGMGIVEDDWGSDMLPFSEFRTGLRALGGENVVYVNSFTKKLWPSLRLGYLVASEEMMPALLAAKRVSNLGNPTIIEAALFEFLDRGYYDTHLKKLQEALEKRYRACLECLRAVMPEGVKWTEPGGGPVLWLEIPRSISITKLYDAVEKRGVMLDRRVFDVYFSTPTLNGFRIGYAQHTEADMARALEIVAQEIRKQL